MVKKYRSRIYNAYISASHEIFAPAGLEGLRPREPYLINLIRNYFPADRDATILDLGCGSGALIYFAQQLGYRKVRGVDGSPEQVAIARRLGIESVEQGDLMDATKALPDASLDCIVAFDVIEHFTKGELIELADEVNRALKSGGRWIIHTVNGESPFGMRMRYGDLTHELAFTQPSMCQLLRSSGFSQVFCYEDRPIVHGVKSAFRWGLWQVIRSVLRLYLVAETGDVGEDAIFSQNFLTIAFKP